MSSFICSIVSPAVLAVFIAIGGMQHVGYLENFDTMRFEPWAKPLMLALCIAAIVLSYRAQSQIALSNGQHSGATLALVGRRVGYCWGAFVVVTILIWGL